MERNLNNEDFEEFLKFKTDNYKLYPSDKVWRGINQSLHTRKRWFQIGGSLLLLSTLLFVGYEFNDHTAKAKTPEQIKTNVTAVIDKTSTTAGISEQIILAGSVGNAAAPYRKKNVAKTTSPFVLSQLKIATADAPLYSLDNQISEPAGIEPVAMNVPEEKAVVVNEDANILEIKPQEAEDENNSDKNQASTSATETERVVHDRSEINWLQEMAALRLTSVKRNRFNLQFYFSPTISYRKLTDGHTAKELSNVPLATNQLEIKNFVDHKPSIGLELGSNLLFAPSKKLTLKTGLQLNYSRYTIKAYKFYFEKANIALVSSGRIADTMSSYTSLRNFNGYSPEDLQNQYVQLSLPIGAELKLLGNKRLQLNVAGTVQPSYLLYNDTYLLSTDFINYTKEPSLVRKWNVNTSAEAFLSYYIGGMRWQVGPQFRYQTLSSYNDRYPIKEYLFEYGVKFGVSKTIR